MNIENLLTPGHIRIGHHHLPVKTTGAQQRRIQHVRTVGGGDKDDAFIRLKTVHLNQKLVQRLFALVIAAAKPGAAMTAHRINLINEDDAGRVLFRLIEHVAHAARADAHKHFNEVGTRNGEERHIRLTRNGAGEQCLTGARRTNKQRAFRDLAAEALELHRVFQIFDDFLKLFLGFVDARHIVKCDPALTLGQQFRARLAKAHGLAARALHLAHDEQEERKENEQRQNID